MTQNAKPAVERLVAEDVRQTVWLRLRRLTSSRLCRQIVSARASALSPEVLDSKSEGVAWAVRSALGYWDTNPADLNARILTRYYALLQISIAEQVASPNLAFDLNEVQRHTEQGHGLSTLSDPSAIFPDSYYLACLRSGHFYSYCRYKEINLGEYAFEKRPPRVLSKLNPEEQRRLVSLTDLFRRVPELSPVVEEYLGVHPLSLHVGIANKYLPEMAHQNWRRNPHPGRNPAYVPPDQITYIAVYPQGSKITEAYLNSLGLPIKNITAEHDGPTNSHYFVGKFTHPDDSYWWQHLDTYKSGYSGTSIIVPLWGEISDAFVIHFMVLYALSIVVRYLPSLWHNIENGDLNHIRALIEHYLAIVDSVLPRMSVERITGVHLRIDQPGSMGAPV
ncbi:MAG TPA: hypothetical protein VIH89_01995 [Candidatus Sulfotelmatobacter sp.]